MRSNHLLDERKPIKLSHLNDLISPDEELQHNLPATWGGFFQSPVNKEAFTLDSKGGSFRFDSRGALDETRLEDVVKLLATWAPTYQDEIKLINDTTPIKTWLKNGKPLPLEILRSMKRKLREESLTNHMLYGQPICRLVHQNQLRYDPNYQAVYQVTPGQWRLLNPQHKGTFQSQLEKVTRNQKIYWGISEVLQSLIAMFDSDLGRYEPRRSLESEELPDLTTEFIRIQVEGEGKKPVLLGPAELNEFSPLRFWAPPPAFCQGVFHMIFWRAIITGRDLFNRPVVEPQEKNREAASTNDAPNLFSDAGNHMDVGRDTVETRVSNYYVIINWFNGAKYRIADYGRLLEALMAIAAELNKFPSNVALNHRKMDLKLEVCEEENILSPIEKPTRLFYANEFSHTNVNFQRVNFPHSKLSLTLPLASASSNTWELTQRYRDPTETGPTRVFELKKFIRDKCLELILWSKYQMEIRSVGIVPVQHLYRIALTDSGKHKLHSLKGRFDSHSVDKAPPDDPRLSAINDEISSAIKSKEIYKWFDLIKIYGGAHRDIIDREKLADIATFRAPGSNLNSIRTGEADGQKN